MKGTKIESPWKWLLFQAFVVVLISDVILGFDELELTKSQRKSLDRFIERVRDKLPEDYMKEELYLLRFLRAKYFDVTNAEKYIMDNLKWRETNNMTSIVDENFSDIEADHHMYMDIVDKEGHPVISVDAGDWDIRRTIASGKMKRLLRYLEGRFEMMTRKVREIQASGNKNVTQFVVLVNLHNYNVLQHGCIQCLPLYVHMTNVYEKFYPGVVDKAIMVNTPPVFESVLSVIKPLMSQWSREKLMVYGYDKSQWEPILHELISPDQLLPEYGGTRKEPVKE